MIDETLRPRNPDKPWLWRRDWSEGIVRDDYSDDAAFYWIFGTLLTLGGTWGLFAAGRARQEIGVLITIGAFTAVGVLFLVAAIRGTIRGSKFGETTCHLDHIPISPGGQIRGELQTRMPELPRDGFLFDIRCTQQRTGRHGTSSFLWTGEQRVASAGLALNPSGVRVPFSIEIPSTAVPTDETDPSVRILWTMSVFAHVNGVDFQAQFALPVFNPQPGRSFRQSQRED